MDGGVTAPKGFKAAGSACGIKKDNKPDIAVVSSDTMCTAVGMFTKNVVKGHSLQITMEHINNEIKAIVINSGNANACVGVKGKQDALEIARLAAELLNCKSNQILFNSTGVIGKPLNMDALRNGLMQSVQSLSYNGGNIAARAIMTTDTKVKEVGVAVEVNNTKVSIGGMAKGSGMIHPNMATMIGVITTDASISQELMDKAFKESVNSSFNRISVDGDTSVCDMVVLLSNAMAKNDIIDNEQTNEYSLFKKALSVVCEHLAKEIVKDGEGATKIIEISVQGAKTPQNAYDIVNAVGKSPLVKTAIFGEDANWGRIITAAGYSGADFKTDLIDIYIGDLKVCHNGVAVDFDEQKAKQILEKNEVSITIQLNMGSYNEKMWVSDFSCDYVKINSNYRS
ncbi:MAG: bifunctional glutamate N-acetyltransferase/amino-acid acetyltransferase ArgJ [Clostridiaceae bacterium]|nr:bifunctional glutamate N-acetyltransferase/amino-acid acetyltransferase ArgJ [Clostridiaceae bacterium]